MCGGGRTIENLARLFKLLGDANRLRILFTMADEPKSVSQIIEMTRLSQPLVSFHLKALREAGLVVAKRHGTMVFNALCDTELPRLLKQFEKYGLGQEGQRAPFCFPCPFPCPPWAKE